jgi:hypothetical protein
MKAGRNDPCPCGSGKKFKKCCLTKTTSESTSEPGDTSLASFPPAFHRHASHRAESSVAPAAKSPPPPDPEQERWDAFWDEFEAQDWEGRKATLLQTLDDDEMMSDEAAFEMLSTLHEEAVAEGKRASFAELLGELKNRQPELYQQSAAYYLSWRLQDALAESPPDILPVARELATYAGQDFDTFHRCLQTLAYHRQFDAIIEAMRLAWPFVQSSSDILPWGKTEFAASGADYEIYNYLEHTPSPDTRDPGLLDRIRFFVADPDLDKLTLHIADIAGQDIPAWSLDDFALKPARKKRRDDWDDRETERDAPPDPGAYNLSRLISQFVGYLRREEGIPFSRAELIQDHLFRYFIRRHEGELNPKLSMYEQAINPQKTLPPAPKPIHPLCPERVTFEVYLTKLVGFMNAEYHTAAALFEIVPPWLRFLESRSLIDADQHSRTIENLRPLQADLLKLMKSYPDEPAFLHALQAWPNRDDSARLEPA